MLEVIEDSAANTKMDRKLKHNELIRLAYTPPRVHVIPLSIQGGNATYV